MSFPYLSDAVKALTGYDLPLPIPMFGLLVACAAIAAAEESTGSWSLKGSAGRSR